MTFYLIAFFATPYPQVLTCVRTDRSAALQVQLRTSNSIPLAPPHHRPSWLTHPLFSLLLLLLLLLLLPETSNFLFISFLKRSLKRILISLILLGKTNPPPFPHFPSSLSRHRLTTLKPPVFNRPPRRPSRPCNLHFHLPLLHPHHLPIPLQLHPPRLPPRALRALFRPPLLPPSLRATGDLHLGIITLDLSAPRSYSMGNRVGAGICQYGISGAGECGGFGGQGSAQEGVGRGGGEGEEGEGLEVEF